MEPPLWTLPLSKTLQDMAPLSRALLCPQPTQMWQMFAGTLSQPCARLRATPLARGCIVGDVGMDTLQCCSHGPRDSIPSRLEMRSFGVKVCVIEPGYFKTMITNVENLENNFISSWQKVPEEIKASYGEVYLRQCKYLSQRLSDALSLLTQGTSPGPWGSHGGPAAPTPCGATWLCSAAGSHRGFLPPQLWRSSR